MKLTFALLALVGLTLAGWSFNYGSKPKPELLSSYYSLRSFFDNAYANAKPIPPVDVPAVGLLVNHHLLAADLIAQGFNTVKSLKPVTVVLLSPNHFGVGAGQILSTKQSWNTPYGVLSADTKLIDSLVADDQLILDNRPFAKEHGVSGVVPFVKASLPSAKIVPIIFKFGANQVNVDKFIASLAKVLPKDAIIVASIDMSHYVAESQAVVQDAKTIAMLQTGDSTGIWKAELDSPQSAYVLMQLMARKNKHFNLLVRSSSASKTSFTNPLDNTSYITGFYN